MKFEPGDVVEWVRPGCDSHPDTGVKFVLLKPSENLEDFWDMKRIDNSGDVINHLEEYLVMDTFLTEVRKAKP